MPKHNISHRQDFFPVGSVTKFSTAKCWRENLVENFKIFAQDFVTMKTGVSMVKNVVQTFLLLSTL